MSRVREADKPLKAQRRSGGAGVQVYISGDQLTAAFGRGQPEGDIYYRVQKWRRGSVIIRLQGEQQQ